MEDVDRLAQHQTIQPAPLHHFDGPREIDRPLTLKRFEQRGVGGGDSGHGGTITPPAAK